MKKILFLFVASLTMLASCTNSGNENKTEQTTEPVADTTAVTQKDYVEVLYFHGEKRCNTCRAIERLTKELLDEQFANELKTGAIKFQVINFSLPENEAMEKKFEVATPSLFLIKHHNGTEQIENLTGFGFTNALGSPDAFKDGVKKDLQAMLK